ncbi:hypothetical protein LR48_Vigan205s001900 [Vigna angularis]|uniref:Uncharacterized protein n=1 Tax=Phaseolus angularis TaxID=3914 RepID=A0A0L9T5N0_PHAAN|nr:hypothetical protein LR48_Vigan205s001900 [Vigna angularis]
MFDVGMASSSGKRFKTTTSKKKGKEPDQPYSSKFLSRKHECYFNVVQDRRLLMERKDGLIPNFAPQFGEQLENRNLGRLATYLSPANIAVVKEFYTNARRFLDTECDGEQCQFALNMEEGADFGDVESVLWMASSSGKRFKTTTSKKKGKEPDQPYSSKFLSRKHECYFNVVQDRRLLMERKDGLIPNFAPQFGEQLENRNLGRLATYLSPANIAVVKEFYTNARRLGDHPAEDYLSYVRGHAI